MDRFTSTAEEGSLGYQPYVARCICTEPRWEKLGRPNFHQISHPFTGGECCRKESVVCGKQVQVYRCITCRGIEERAVTGKVIFCLSCRRRIDQGT